MFAMFGRAGQLATVDEARSDATAGHGRLLLMTGEPGIGKSLLAQQAMDRAAAQGFRTELPSGYAATAPNERVGHTPIVKAAV